jgi:O-antigen ligase
MIVMAVWAILVLIFAWPLRRRIFYRALAGSAAALVLAAVLFWPQISTSFAANRLEDGVKGLASSEGFIRNQFAHTLESAPEWFPWGFGPGKGKLVNREDLQEHEIHNGLLAVVVELGAFGLLAFLGMVLGPLARLRYLGRNDRSLAVLTATFLLTSLVFMTHNTLYRDRTFLVFLGILSGFVRKGEGSPA